MQAKMAIVYDFDKTLSTDDMQAFGFIQSLGLEVDEFWDMCAEFGEKYQADNILTCMYMMVKKSKENGINLTKEYLNSLGKNVEFFKGLDKWFDRINKFGAKNGIEVEHYVVSSGLKEIIEGTKIAKYFKEIYACYFIYENNLPVWPALSLNYTNKTQFLYRINKGIYGVRDTLVNEEMAHKDRPIPFKNIVYIGDSMTDIPSMRLITKHGGTAIGLYQPNTKNEQYLRELLRHERIDFVAEADYREDKECDTIIKQLIEKISHEYTLEQIREQQKQVK